MADKKSKTSTLLSRKALEKKLADARTLMIMVMPHFAPLLEMAERYRKISVKDDVATAQTYPDGSMEFGSAFLTQLSEKQTAFIIAHELGHHYMGTFSRVKTADPDLCKLVNIASDTQINHMVATYFEAHNFKTIREEMKDGMWWEKDRYWDNFSKVISLTAPGCSDTLPEDIIEIGLEVKCKKTAEEYKLEKLCESLLPAERFVSIDEMSMEDIVAALLIFSRESESKSLEIFLQNVSLNGSVVCKQKQSFPFVLSIGDIHPQTDNGQNNPEKVFIIDAEKINPSKKEIIDVLSKLKLNLKIFENTGQQQDVEIPISWNDNSDTGHLLPGGESVFHVSQIIYPPFVLEGSLILRYAEDGTLSLNGILTFRTKQCADQGGQGSGQGQGTGQEKGLGSGDLRSKDELKERCPGLSDEEIDRRIQEMEQARRQASSLVSGQGTVQDVEVRDGLYNVPWQAFLQNWLDGYSRIVRTFNRASRRGDLPDPRCCLPGHARCGYSINIVLDTSVSMGNYLPDALGAIAAFCERNAVDMIKIIECDAAVQDIKEITPDELRDYTIKGMGGTDMTPGMLAYLNEPDVKGVIVITDGEFNPKLNIPQMRLPYDVLWCLVGPQKRINVPYGKQVHIK